MESQLVLLSDKLASILTDDVLALVVTVEEAEVVEVGVAEVLGCDVELGVEDTVEDGEGDGVLADVPGGAPLIAGSRPAYAIDC